MIFQNTHTESYNFRTYEEILLLVHCSGDEYGGGLTIDQRVQNSFDLLYE